MPLRPPVRIVLSAASAGERIVLPLEKGLEMEFVRIPAGEFLMGSDPEKDGWADYTEVPQHRVNLSEYWMGRTPVTNAQYAVFTLSTGAKVPEHWRNNQPPQDLLDHPVVFVSWHEAVACCEWLSQQTGRRVGLPTEAQWEKAARGTDGRLYPWGSEAPDAARCNFNRNNQTTPVGSTRPWATVLTAAWIWPGMSSNGAPIGTRINITFNPLPIIPPGPTPGSSACCAAAPGSIQRRLCVRLGAPIPALPSLSICGASAARLPINRPRTAVTGSSTRRLSCGILMYPPPAF